MIPTSDPAAQLEHAQQLLVEFLRVDLEFAFTLLRTAEIEAGESPEHQKASLTHVHEALGAIRHLTTRILNPQSRREIEAKARELETAVAAFKQGRGNEVT